MSAEDREIAGEYVLGTLPHADRLAFAARLKAEPALRALVAEWEERLADLNDAYDESSAPDLLPAIEARLFPKPTRRWPLWLGGLATATAVFLGALVLPPLLAPDAPPVMAIRSVKDEPRLTLTASALRGAIHTHLLITGADKREALERAQKLDPTEAPIREFLSDITVHWAE